MVERTRYGTLAPQEPFTPVDPQREISTQRQRIPRKHRVYVVSNVSTNPQFVNLSEHNGLMIQNIGAVDVYFSNTVDSNFELWLQAGVAKVFDNHEDTHFFIKTIAGTSSVRIETW